MSMTEEKVLDYLADEVVKKLATKFTRAVFPVGISNRHLHLSADHLALLFGAGSQLTPKRMLIQPGQYAAEQVVMVVGPRGCLRDVRIIGPLRKQTQIELARTDCIAIGIEAPLRVSGNLQGTPGCVLVGPRGSVTLAEGVIVAARHIHLEPARAAALGLADRQMASVTVPGERGVRFEQVIIRPGTRCSRR